MRRYLLFFVGIIIGIFRFWIVNPVSEDHFCFDRNICGIYFGDILAVSNDGTKQKVFLNIYELDNEGNKFSRTGNVNVNIPPYPKVFEGDKIQFYGCENSQIKNLDFKEYFYSKNIYCGFDNIEILSINSGTLNDVKGFLRMIKKKTINNIERILIEPHSSLALGLTIGFIGDMPNNFSRIVQFTGMSHIVAISGYNLSLVVNFIITGITNFVNRKKGIVISFFLMWIFTFFVGFNPPVTRAAFMMSFILLGSFMGLPSLSFIGYLVSITAMLILNPILLINVSFQLSTFATLGILVFPDIFNDILAFVKFEYIRESIATSISAFLLTTPIIIYYFKSVYLLSIFPNVLISGIIGFLTVISFIMILSSFINIDIAYLIANFSVLGFKYVEFILDFFSKFKIFKFNISLNFFEVFLCYFTIFVFFIFLKK